jgi:RAB6A-GEF complex partner protein 1
MAGLVYVKSMTTTRGMDVETWITSDGRAYFVQLAEGASASNASTSDIDVSFF